MQRLISRVTIFCVDRTEAEKDAFIGSGATVSDNFQIGPVVNYISDDGTTLFAWNYIFYNMVTDVQIDESLKDLSKKAKVTFPLNKNYFSKNLNLYSTSSGIFRRNDRIVIELGYYPNLRPVFNGYITKVHSVLPIVLECQDSMYILMNRVVTFPVINASQSQLDNFTPTQKKAYEIYNATTKTAVAEYSINDLLNFILPYNKLIPDSELTTTNLSVLEYADNNPPFSLKDSFIYSFDSSKNNQLLPFSFPKQDNIVIRNLQKATQIGNVRYSRMTVAKILDDLKQIGFFSYFVDISEEFGGNFNNTIPSAYAILPILNIGMLSDASFGTTSYAEFCGNIIKDDTEYQLEKDVLLRVTCINKNTKLLSNDPKYSTEVTVGDAEGAQKTYNFQNLTEDELITRAKNILKSFKYTTLKGSITTFGDQFATDDFNKVRPLFVKPGDRLDISIAPGTTEFGNKNIEKVGVYQVAGVKRSFNKSGYRQIIEFGIKYSIDSVTGENTIKFNPNDITVQSSNAKKS